jgi:hypothetical protein
MLGVRDPRPAMLGPYPYARFFDPVAHLGVTEVRYTGGRDGKPMTIHFFVPIDSPKENVAAIARVAREVSEPMLCTIIGRRQDGGGSELWAPDLASRLARIGSTIAREWNVPAEVVEGL